MADTTTLSADIKPKIPPKSVNFENIPQELKALPQWVVAPPDKKPYDAKTGKLASSDDPRTWSTFEKAKSAYNSDGGWAHVGFESWKNDGISVIDLDGCFYENGELHEDARIIVELANSKTEYSPSREGLHIFVLDNIGHPVAEWGRDKCTNPGWQNLTEKSVLEIWSRKQYCTVTGWVFEGRSKMRTCDGILKVLYGNYEFGSKKTLRNKGHAPSDKGQYPDLGHDDELLQLGREKIRGFREAFDEGKKEGIKQPSDNSDSGYDFRMFGWMSRLTGNPSQNERLARKSHTEYSDNPKWHDRSDYLTRTISNIYSNGYKGPNLKLKKKEIPPVVHDTVGRATINTQQQDRELVECVHVELLKSATAFQRNGELAAIVHCEDEHGKTHRIQSANKGVLHDMISEEMGFQTASEKPASLADNLIRKVAVSAHRHDYPLIRKINTCPSLRRNGSTILDQGYDAESHTYGVFPEGLARSVVSFLPTNPTQKDGHEAAKWLLELFSQFPFVDDASRTHFIALLITLVCKDLIGGLVPLFIIDANNQSAGKSLLCICLCLIATGKETPYTMHQGNETQMRADILTAFRAAFPFLVYGNLDPDKVFRSKVLSDALTSGAVFDRKYLTNDEYLMADNEAVIAANGNNAQVDTDIMDRSIWIQLCADDDHPEDRDPDGFKVKIEHGLHLKDYCRVHRGEILAKVLTIALSYLAAENKPNGKHWSKFPGWTEVIGSMIEYVGLKDFRGNVERLRKTKNVEKSEIARFLYGILENQAVFVEDGKIKGPEFTVRAFADERLGTDNDPSPAQRELASVLPYKVTKAKDRNQALGFLFARIAGTPFYGYIVRQVGDDPHIHKPKYQIEAPKKDFEDKQIEKSRRSAETMKKRTQSAEAAKKYAEGVM